MSERTYTQAHEVCAELTSLLGKTIRVRCGTPPRAYVSLAGTLGEDEDGLWEVTSPFSYARFATDVVRGLTFADDRSDYEPVVTLAEIVEQ